MNFEEGSVLESTDGVSYTKEKILEKRDDSTRGKSGVAVRGDKSLAEQLADAKEKKDEDWKEKNNPFRAPKALDDEDVAFLTELAAAQRREKDATKTADENELEQFKVLTQHTTPPPHHHHHHTTHISHYTLID